MGLYATTTAISELLPGYLAGNTTTSDTAGVNIFSRHVDRTEGIVNSYLAARYSLPFVTTTSIPVIVRVITEDISSWMAIRSTTLQNAPLGQERKEAFDRAWIDLEALRDGKLKLTLTNGSEVATRTTRYVTSTDYQQVFDLDKPDSWEVDPDQVSDIADRRT